MRDPLTSAILTDDWSHVAPGCEGCGVAATHEDDSGAALCDVCDPPFALPPEQPTPLANDPRDW
jgi:hypothetical protein